MSNGPIIPHRPDADCFAINEKTLAMAEEINRAVIYGVDPVAPAKPVIYASCCDDGSQIAWCGFNGWCVMNGYDCGVTTVNFCPWCGVKLPEQGVNSAS